MLCLSFAVCNLVALVLRPRLRGLRLCGGSRIWQMAWCRAASAMSGLQVLIPSLPRLALVCGRCGLVSGCKHACVQASCGVNGPLLEALAAAIGYHDSECILVTMTGGGYWLP